MCFSLFFTTSPIDSHCHQRLADSWLQRLYSLVFWQCDENPRKSNGVSKKDYMQFLFNLFNIAQSYPQTACWKDLSTIWMSECTKDSCSHYEHDAGISPKARAWVRTSAIPRNMQESTWFINKPGASSFRLDLRSFWLFMLTWSGKRAFVSWRTGICVFSGYLRFFPGKIVHHVCFKMRKVQKCQKWCNYAHVEKNRSKSRNLSNEHLFVFFRGYRYHIYIYVQSHAYPHTHTYLCTYTTLHISHIIHIYT